MNSKSKLSQLISILLMSLLLTFITSCSKEDNGPIRLYHSIYKDTPDPVKDNQVTIIYPTSEKTQLLILGGDGNYAANNSNETILTVKMGDGLIELTPLSIGSSVVTITDQSGNSYILNVKIAYREVSYKIVKQDVVVIGDDLTPEQKKEIQQKASLTLPVKVNGGFKLVFNTDKQDKGQALIYKESFGQAAIESTFEKKQVEIKDVDGNTQSHPALVIVIDGKQRVFLMTRYYDPQSRAEAMVPMAWIEDLTEQFKEEYPNAKLVYTQQRFHL